MKNSWQISPMAALCSIKSGKSNSEDAEESGKYAFFDRSKKVKKSTRYLYDCEALIIPGEGAEFLPRHFIGKFDLHQRAYALFDFSKSLDVRFLFYYLTHFKDYFVKVAVGATVKSLRLRHFEQLPVPVPPLPEQQRIVGILDEAFDGLATAKANAEKNLQNARALFESHLQSVFTQRDPGWDDDQLDALTEPDSPITYGVVKPGDEGEIRFVRGGDLVRSKVRLDQLRTITRAVSDQYRRTLLRGGELLICLVGQPGQVAVAPEELAGANIARQVGLIRLKKNMNAEFVRYFLQSAPGAEALGARESGSVQQVINLGELRHLSVPYPQLGEQNEIVAKLDVVEAETQRLESLYQRKLDALDELKKSLLHQAFSGAL